MAVEVSCEDCFLVVGEDGPYEFFVDLFIGRVIVTYQGDRFVTWCDAVDFCGYGFNVVWGGDTLKGEIVTYDDANPSASIWDFSIFPNDAVALGF